MVEKPHSGNDMDGYFSGRGGNSGKLSERKNNSVVLWVTEFCGFFIMQLYWRSEHLAFRGDAGITSSMLKKGIQ